MGPQNRRYVKLPGMLDKINVKDTLKMCVLITPSFTIPRLLPSLFRRVCPTTQNLVLLNSGRRPIVPEALECTGAADDFGGSGG